MTEIRGPQSTAPWRRRSQTGRAAEDGGIPRIEAISWRERGVVFNMLRISSRIGDDRALPILAIHSSYFGMRKVSRGRDKEGILRFCLNNKPYFSNGFARGVKDHHYRLFRRQDAEGRRQYYKDLQGMVRHLYNHPSIAVWVPFNEGWGQFDAGKATEKLRKMDRGRLVNEACGWFDQKGGDMYSIHNYNHVLKVKPQKDRVVALTEYGGYTYPVEGHKACEKKFGYQHYYSSEELTANYRRLWEQEIYPNLEHGLSAAIYTQTSDIEEEINGVMTYDREVDKLIPEEVRKLNQELYERFDSGIYCSDSSYCNIPFWFCGTFPFC